MVHRYAYGGVAPYSMSEKSDRFFSDSRLGTDADATVRPLHAGTPAIPGSRRCPLPRVEGSHQARVSDQQRAGEQLVPNQRRETRLERAGALSPPALSPMMDGSNSSLQARSPCTTATALCFPAAILTHMMPSLPILAHASMHCGTYEPRIRLAYELDLVYEARTRLRGSYRLV